MAADFCGPAKDTISRVRRVCSWCGKWIEIGEPKTSYFYRNYGDPGFENMHRECYSAMQKMDRDDLEMAAGVQFSRGCCCDFGQCECVVGPVEVLQ